MALTDDEINILLNRVNDDDGHLRNSARDRIAEALRVAEAAEWAARHDVIVVREQDGYRVSALKTYNTWHKFTGLTYTLAVNAAREKMEGGGK